MRLAMLAALVAFPAFGSPCKVAKAGLQEKAKVTCEAARAAALAKVKRSRVKSAELEEEKGRLVYSFDLHVEGDKNVHEVQVDAVTGEVVSVEIEDPAREAAEKEAEGR
jgi:uncharacterized membrane protein YkoI